MIKTNENLKEEFEEITQKLGNKGVKFVVECEYKELISVMKDSFELKDKEKKDAF